jgi:signal transduction histidine kinase
LTQHLLSFARKQPLQPIDVDVNLLMLDAIELLKPTIGGHINIDFVPGREVSAALVDPNQLTTAVLNLALNARDAMPGGGNLAIRTATLTLDDEDTKTYDGIAAGEYVAISIGDTGHGIAKPDLARVFDPFFTTKDVGKGTGLGLSMVYGFVKQSGGHIAIESERGRGTTVWIYLPQAEAATMPAAASTTVETARGGTERF